MREFAPPQNAIKAQSSIDIAAPPEHVAGVYRDVENWGEIFPATIERARVAEPGDNWVQIEVTHKMEGRVPNTLIFLSDTEIGLEESKKLFDAAFLNQFKPAAGERTHYVISAYISLKGIYRLLRPFLAGYVHRRALVQMQNYVLGPLKQAAEKDRRLQDRGIKSFP